MRLFDENITILLRPYLLGQCIDSVLLGAYGLVIQISDISIQCNDRVFAQISGRLHEWADAPSKAPWGKLIRQTVSSISLIAPERLRIGFETGDYVEIESLENQYESVVINFPRQGETHVMEIY